MEVLIVCDGYDDTICVIDKHGFLDLDSFQLYPEPFGLIYQINNKNYPVKKVDGKFVSVPDIDTYKVVIQKGPVRDSTRAYSSLSSHQQVQFQEIIKEIKEYDTKPEGKTKPVKRPKIGKKTKSVPRSRLIAIIWKHKNGSNAPFEKMGKDKTLSLISSDEYAVESIKSRAIELFKIPLSEMYFNNNKVSVHIGLKDDTIIENFEIDDEVVDLWKYFHNKGNGHRIQLNLLIIYSEKKEMNRKPLCNNKNMEVVVPLVVPSKSDEPQLIEEDVIGRCNVILQGKENKEQLAMAEGFNLIGDERKAKKFKSDAHEALNTNVNVKTKANSNQQANKSTNTESISSWSDIRSISDFKQPNLPVQRHTIDLDDVKKLPLPFISEIPKDDIKITDQFLGSGAFGCVRVGIHNRSEVAIKVIDILGTTPKSILKEITILKEISHENIVPLVGVCCQYSEFWIVMGLVKGHNLKKIIYDSNIKKLYNLLNRVDAINTKLDFSNQIIKGITYIHKHHLDVIHRDIKPCNILVNQQFKQVKICDLGLAKIKDFSSILLTTQGKRMPFGTPLYMAPEVLIYSKQATKASDVWSLACTLAELFQEKHIWANDDNSYALNHPEQLLRGEEVPNILDVVPHDIKNILMKGLDYNPSFRPTTEEMMDMFASLVL